MSICCWNIKCLQPYVILEQTYTVRDTFVLHVLVILPALNVSLVSINNIKKKG